MKKQHNSLKTTVDVDSNKQYVFIHNPKTLQLYEKAWQYYFTITPPYWHYPVDPLREEGNEPYYPNWDPVWTQYQYSRIGGDHGIYATVPLIPGES